jgi:hypothetical protein
MCCVEQVLCIPKSYFVIKNLVVRHLVGNILALEMQRLPGEFCISLLHLGGIIAYLGGGVHRGLPIVGWKISLSQPGAQCSVFKIDKFFIFILEIIYTQ